MFLSGYAIPVIILLSKYSILVTIAKPYFIEVRY